MSVRAIKAGAIDFLTKPVAAEILIAAVRAAIDRRDRAPAAEPRRPSCATGSAALTPREREVLAGLVAGRLNKQIAADLGVVEQTVKFHRARIMERMQAKYGRRADACRRSRRSRRPGGGKRAGQPRDPPPALAPQPLTQRTVSDDRRRRMSA